MKDILKSQAMNENNPKWKNAIKRENEMYPRNNDMRSEFERDYTRIIHCNAYRRLKHKTQAFFSPENDHICTRIEHVTHVESISHTISKYLGLNEELTKAIATGHDLGHGPFGHQGEKMLSEISEREIGKTFWHEKNGVDLVDKIELLEDTLQNKQNLNLTYAVRDGIISHCGEIDENSLKPREEYIDLTEYKKPNEYPPFTWEGCVVKVSDKISYLWRDIEDAIALGILDEHLNKLYKLLNIGSDEILNNTVLINDFIYDICKNSSPEKGICFSEKTCEMMNKIKGFNYEHIYLSRKVTLPTEYFKLIINTIFDTLKSAYDEKNTLKNIRKMKRFYPNVARHFEEWLCAYWNLERDERYKNSVIFNIENEKEYAQAIIYYISGMTDNYAIETYKQIIGF